SGCNLALGALRLTAAMILSGSAVHVKGFGSALVSARKRLMAAWGSTTERKRPRFRRRRLFELEVCALPRMHPRLSLRSGIWRIRSTHFTGSKEIGNNRVN